MTAALDRECAIDGCGKPVRARGWCRHHYFQWWAHGDPLAERPVPRTNKVRECSVEGCSRPAHTRGWCQSHYNRWRKHGDVLANQPIQPHGDWQHGTTNGYGNHHCRCQPCRDAWAVRQAGYNRRAGLVDPATPYKPQAERSAEADYNRKNGVTKPDTSYQPRARGRTDFAMTKQLAAAIIDHQASVAGSETRDADLKLWSALDSIYLMSGDAVCSVRQVLEG